MKLLDNIENLAYGNINRDNLAYLTKESFFNDYIDIFENKEYPNLKQTEKELEYLIKNQKEYMRKPNWSKYKAFCEACDDDIKKVIYNRLNEINGCAWYEDEDGNTYINKSEMRDQKINEILNENK